MRIQPSSYTFITQVGVKLESVSSHDISKLITNVSSTLLHQEGFNRLSVSSEQVDLGISVRPEHGRVELRGGVVAGVHDFVEPAHKVVGHLLALGLSKGI